MDDKSRVSKMGRMTIKEMMEVAADELELSRDASVVARAKLEAGIDGNKINKAALMMAGPLISMSAEHTMAGVLMRATAEICARLEDIAAVQQKGIEGAEDMRDTLDNLNGVGPPNKRPKGMVN